MVGYRRNLISGGTFFFTVALKDRQSTYLVDYIDHLFESMQKVKGKAPFDEIAIVILPDHLHTIWKLPEDDFDYPGRWKAVKSQFTRALVKSGEPLFKNNRGEYPLWQRRYWEHTIRNEEDLRSHIDYIHFNPIKHGYVGRVSDWPLSSFNRFVRMGILPQNWGGDQNDFDDMEFGE